MFQQKISYFLVRLNEAKEATYAVGTLFKADIKDAREQYEMQDAEIMEESEFKTAFPDYYKELFNESWERFMFNFLKSLSWIDYDNEIFYDEDNVSYAATWFRLEQDIISGNLLLNFHVLANQDRVLRLLKEIKEYIGDTMPILVNPPSYPSQIDSQIYYGERAVQRMLAEIMTLSTNPN